MEWWQLPGPRSFVSAISNDLRDGKNVLVCLPDFVYSGIYKEVRQIIGRDIPWKTLSCQNLRDFSLVDWLYHSFGVTNGSPKDIRSIRFLMQEPSFLGQVVWIDDPHGSHWPDWYDLLEEYKHLCRGVDLINRTVFCLVFSGGYPEHLPHEDVCLSIRKFDGNVSELDIQLMVSSRLSRHHDYSILNELKIEMVASLAQWDGSLAESLMKKKLHELLHIENFLQTEAASRQWTDSENWSADKSWSCGSICRMNGQIRVHSCICALQNSKEVQRRIWRAQVRVLYPFVEEQRQIILERVAPFLRLPYRTRFGDLIEDVMDLEIGHIESLLKTEAGFRDGELLDRIQVLREIRNRLAHMEVVEGQLLKSKALKQPL